MPLQQSWRYVLYINLLFQVSRHSLYLTDEDNVAVVAGTSGIFRPVDLLGHSHYEVHGVEDASVPTIASTIVPAPASANTRFSFARSASTSSATAVTAPRPAAKGFQR